MASEVLRIMAQIVSAHASMSELTPGQLVEEIKEVYKALISMEGGEAMETPSSVRGKEAVVVKKPPIPLKDIVKNKYVVCLECGQKMRTLKTHLKKAHNLLPKEYFQRYGLDRKKYPLVCKEYSQQRRKLALEKGLGAKKGDRRKAAKPA